MALPGEPFAIAVKRLPGELWNEIAHLFPERQQPSDGGRHPNEHASGILPLENTP
jgi:hypothetical protein